MKLLAKSLGYGFSLAISLAMAFYLTLCAVAYTDLAKQYKTFTEFTGPLILFFCFAPPIFMFIGLSLAHIIVVIKQLFSKSRSVKILLASSLIIALNVFIMLKWWEWAAERLS